MEPLPEGGMCACGGICDGVGIGLWGGGADGGADTTPLLHSQMLPGASLLPHRLQKFMVYFVPPLFGFGDSF